MERFVRVIKKRSVSGLEGNINEVLTENKEHKLVDIKVSGSYTGDQDIFIAVLIFEKY